MAAGPRNRNYSVPISSGYPATMRIDRRSSCRLCLAPPLRKEPCGDFYLFIRVAELLFSPTHNLRYVVRLLRLLGSRASCPSDWEHSQDDTKLGEVMRLYWVQFAKTGDPNAASVPEWPVYDAHSDQCLDLGRILGARPVPHIAQLLVLEHIMKQIFAGTWNAPC
jgi:hypothetical protein